MCPFCRKCSSRDAIPRAGTRRNTLPARPLRFFGQAHRAGATAVGPVDLELLAYLFRLLSYPFG